MATKNRWLVLASYASVLVAVILIAVKLVTWFLTDSVSIMASLLDSIMDSLASLVNLVAIRYAIKPADDEHRFGHGKAEALAAVAQAAFIIGSGLLLLLYSVQRLLQPGSVELHNTDVGISVMLIATALTLGLVLLQRHAIKVTNSPLIKTDSLHYQTDLLINISIIAALLLAHFGWSQVDVYMGLAIAAYICWEAGKLGYQSLQSLMDRELPPEIDEQIAAIALRQDGVQGLHDLRTRQAGSNYIVQMHIEMDETMALQQAHAIADNVERQIEQAFPGSDVIVHQDPVQVALA
ncbi:MAG: cation diffusion facilitator family transporter [Pseudomonadales bacterium]